MDVHREEDHGRVAVPDDEEEQLKVRVLLPWESAEFMPCQFIFLPDSNSLLFLGYCIRDIAS